VAEPKPQFLEVGHEGATRRLAFLKQDGQGPTVVWLGGFRSDMRATKAEALAQWAADQDRTFLRFDYGGHGESDGDFADATLSMWLDDALAILAAHVPAPAILVGSSMGGWISLLATRRLREVAPLRAPCGLVLIAPAVDFTQELMWPELPPAIRELIARDGVWMRPSAYSPEPTPITRALFEDAKQHLMFGRPITTGCPVHILQGLKDPDVPWPHAIRLVEHLPSDPVKLALVRDGDHRLSSPEDIARLIAAVAEIQS
jgi:pimeloyl-ACP methyl ester carboxylesterase